MPRSSNLSSLRTQVRQHANMENSLFVTDSEVNSYISQSWAELYELMVNSAQDYFTTSSTITLVNGTDTYNLPGDFFRLRGVDAVLSGFTFDVQPFNFNERNLYSNAVGWVQGHPVAYRLVGNTIKFIPVPSGSGTAKLWYIPEPNALSGDSDAIDHNAVAPAWEEYVVVDAAIKCLVKEESDPSVLLAQKEALRQRILGGMPARDAAHPSRVTDVRFHRMRVV